MKRYWIILLLAIVIGFGGIGLIIFHSNAARNLSWAVTYLQINKNNRANKITDSTFELAVIKYFPCNEKNEPGDICPWANVYVCRSFNSQDSLSGDSLLVLLETNPKRNYSMADINNSFSITAKASKDFSECRVMLPPHEMDSLKMHKFRYGEIKEILFDCGNQ